MQPRQVWLHTKLALLLIPELQVLVCKSFLQTQQQILMYNCLAVFRIHTYDAVA